MATLAKMHAALMGKPQPRATIMRTGGGRYFGLLRRDLHWHLVGMSLGFVAGGRLPLDRIRPTLGVRPVTIAAPAQVSADAGRLERFRATLQPHEIMLPEECFRAPSKINIWRGSRFPQDLFTRAQLGALAFHKLDPESVDFFTCRSKATREEWYWNEGHKHPVFVLPCPVMRRDRDGRRVVINPYGTGSRVPDHGWVKYSPFEKGVQL